MRTVLLAVVMSLALCPIRAVSKEPLPVSMNELIANPQKFDGRLVVVVGFLSLGREHPFLFTSREDSEDGVFEHAVWVYPNGNMKRNKKKISPRYVRLVGRFRAGQSGRRYPTFVGGASGGITNIKSCIAWSDAKDPHTK